ncbi:MAG: PD-(D/E)XK nuclease family transposase [Caldilineaceae bacterium]
MKYVAPLRYDVIFKKAFSDPQIFTAFVEAVLGVKLEIDKVETEKSFAPPIGRVASRFDLFAEDTKNRVIVDIQHVRYEDHYDAFLHYDCAAILDQVVKAENYRPNLAVYSIIVLTSGDKHKVDWAIIDFDPKTRQPQSLGEIPHKVIYLCPKYANDETPEPLREWLRAIDDTLDTQVEESPYQHPQIRRIFDQIEQDQVSPEERARMFEEYNQAQARQAAFQEGKTEERFAIARSLLAEGMTASLIAKVTGLSEEEVRDLTFLEK